MVRMKPERFIDYLKYLYFFFIEIRLPFEIREKKKDKEKIMKENQEKEKRINEDTLSILYAVKNDVEKSIQDNEKIVNDILK